MYSTGSRTTLTAVLAPKSIAIASKMGCYTDPARIHHDQLALIAFAPWLPALSGSLLRGGSRPSPPCRARHSDRRRSRRLRRSASLSRIRHWRTGDGQRRCPSLFHGSSQWMGVARPSLPPFGESGNLHSAIGGIFLPPRQADAAVRQVHPGHQYYVSATSRKQ